MAGATTNYPNTPQGDSTIPKKCGHRWSTKQMERSSSCQSRRHFSADVLFSYFRVKGLTAELRINCWVNRIEREVPFDASGVAACWPRLLSPVDLRSFLCYFFPLSLFFFFFLIWSNCHRVKDSPRVYCHILPFGKENMCPCLKDLS